MLFRRHQFEQGLRCQFCVVRLRRQRCLWYALDGERLRCGCLLLWRARRLTVEKVPEFHVASAFSFTWGKIVADDGNCKGMGCPSRRSTDNTDFFFLTTYLTTNDHKLSIKFCGKRKSLYLCPCGLAADDSVKEFAQRNCLLPASNYGTTPEWRCSRKFLNGWVFESESEDSACTSDIKQTPAGSGQIGK